MALRLRFVEVEPAVDTAVTIACRECGEKAETDLLLSPDFFVPGDGKL